MMALQLGRDQGKEKQTVFPQMKSMDGAMLAFWKHFRILSPVSSLL
jgi:hypothetical protein